MLLLTIIVGLSIILLVNFHSYVMRKRCVGMIKTLEYSKKEDVANGQIPIRICMDIKVDDQTMQHMAIDSVPSTFGRVPDIRKAVFFTGYKYFILIKLDQFNIYNESYGRLVWYDRVMVWYIQFVEEIGDDFNSKFLPKAA